MNWDRHIWNCVARDNRRQFPTPKHTAKLLNSYCTAFICIGAALRNPRCKAPEQTARQKRGCGCQALASPIAHGTGRLREHA